MSNRHVDKVTNRDSTPKPLVKPTQRLRFAPSRTANYVGDTGIEPVTSSVSKLPDRSR
jgi:hypothetical protein